MYFRLILIFLFISFANLVVGQSKSQYSTKVLFETESYDHYYKIDMVKESLENKIILFDDKIGKILEITDFKKAKDSTYINLGNNQIEGTFSGYIDKRQITKLTVIYEKNATPILLTTKDKIFTYDIDDTTGIVIPVKFNIEVKDDDFDEIYLSLFKNDKNHFFDDFDVDFTRNKRNGVKSNLNKTKAGNYKGNVVFKRKGIELVQPIEVNIKHSLTAAISAFITFILLSYLIRYISINEDKVNAYLRANKLLNAVQNDKLIDPIKKEVLLNQIEKHIGEIDLWLNQASYYNGKFDVLLNSYNDIRQLSNLLAEDESNFLSTASLIDILKYGVKFTHTLITVLLCFVPLKIIYFDDLIFGSNGSWDYLKLFAAVLAIVIASKGLIKERINALNTKLG